MIWLLAIFQSLFIWAHTHGMIALTHSIFWLISLSFLFACVVCKCVTFLLLFVWYGFGVLGTVHIGESNFLSFDVCLHSSYSTMPYTHAHKCMSTQHPLIYYVQRFWGKSSTFAWVVCMRVIFVVVFSFFVFWFVVNAHASLWLHYALCFSPLTLVYRVCASRTRPNLCNRPWELDH